MRVSCLLRLAAAWAGLAVIITSVARAADDVAAAPAPESAPEPADEPAENPFAEAPAVVPDPAAWSGLAHPQVNMAGFTREYRAVPIDVSEADIAIRAVLDRRIDGAWELQDASLRDVVRRLRESLGVAVVLDETALEDSGIDPDEGRVTVRLSGLTGRAALRLLLTPFGLTSIAADEAITVTTLDEASQRLTQVAYPLPRWAGVNREAGNEPYFDLIQSTVAAETWDVVGGPGCIRLVEAAGEPLLVISQTGAVHDAVERLLRAIHDRALAEFAGGQPVLKVHRVADDRARADLEKRLKDLCNATLGDEADPAADVTAVAATLAVRSSSPRFHALAAQVIAAVAGVEQPPIPQLPPGIGGGGIGGQ